MKKFEYLVIELKLYSHISKEWEERAFLTEKGEEGWELICIKKNNYYFKREIIPTHL